MHPKKQLRNEAMASAPGLLTLHRPDGAAWEVEVCKPTKSEILKLYEWAKKVHKPNGPDWSFLKGMEPEDKQFYLARLAAENAKSPAKKTPPPTADELEEILLSPEGVARQIFIAGRRFQRDIRIEDVQACVTADNFIDVMCDFDDATKAKMPDAATEAQIEKWGNDPSTGLPFPVVDGMGADSPRRVTE